MHVSLHSGKNVWASAYFWPCTVISNDIKFRSEWADLVKTFSIRLDSLLTSCVSFWRFASTGSWVAVGEPSERAEIKKRKDERTLILEKSRCFYAHGRKISRIRVQPKSHSKSLKIAMRPKTMLLLNCLLASALSQMSRVESNGKVMNHECLVKWFNSIWFNSKQMEAEIN